MKNLLYTLSLACLWVESGQTATLHVSPIGSGPDGLKWESAFSTVGLALAASTADDDIWVASGTYTESIDMVEGVDVYGGFMGTESAEEFHLRNPEANKTILDATGLASNVVRGASGTVLDGFTITRGVAEKGAGISCEGIAMTISNCRVVKNKALHMVSSPTVGTAVAAGGGLYCLNSKILVIQSEFIGNVAATWAAGQYAAGAISSGAGVYCATTDLRLISTSIRGGFADSTALYGRFGNGAVSRGGGLYISGRSTVYLENCLIDRNVITAHAESETEEGAGIFCVGSRSDLTISSCTVVDNARFYERLGSGVQLLSGTAAIKNTIIWNGSGTALVGDATVTFSNVEGIESGTGNINLDPLFADPAGAPPVAGDPGPLGDYRLTLDSPCIDTGSPSGPSEDLEGNPRPRDVAGRGSSGNTAFDMGAYEFPGHPADLDVDGDLDSTDLILFQREWMRVQTPE